LHTIKKPDSLFLLGTNLFSADLKGAHLESANLSASFFFFADLSKAHLQDANLIDSILKEANLQGADLDGADLTEANLAEDDFRGALNLSFKQLSKAKMLYNAKLDEKLSALLEKPK